LGSCGTIYPSFNHTPADRSRRLTGAALRMSVPSDNGDILLSPKPSTFPMHTRRTISISGPPGAGTSTVARILAENLGMEYINSGDIFREMAREKGMPLGEFGNYAKEHEEVDLELDRRQVEIARTRPVILEGRLSGFMLHREKVPSFRIWIDADPEIRAARVLEREGGDILQKMRENDDREKCDKERYRRLYGADYADPSVYTLLIDSSHVVPGLIAERIIGHVKSPGQTGPVVSPGSPGTAGRIIMSRDLTTSDNGRRPEDRTLEELLASGVVVLDKPTGPTSHQVAAWAKDVLGIEKAGHGGTLDPNVSGVLVIALGDATRVIKAMLEAGKEYIAVMRTRRKIPGELIRKTCAEFTGEIYQTPPLESAVKRQLRKRTIYALDVLEIRDTDVLMRVECEAGTYIRTLCEDMGTVLGCGAYMAALRRTRSGNFTEHEAVTLHDLKDAFVFWKEDGDGSHLRRIIRPVEDLLGHMSKIVVKDSAVDALCHGASLAIPGIVELDRGISKGDRVVIETGKGEAVAIARALMDADGMAAKKGGVAAAPVRVIMTPGTYPKMWKSSQG